MKTTHKVVTILLLVYLYVILPPKQTLVVRKLGHTYANGSIETIFIRGDRWSIAVGIFDDVLDNGGFIGYTECEDKTIYVHGSLTYMNQRDTVLHEILHAGTCDTEGNPHNKFFNSDTEAGHEGIYKIAHYMTEVLHDNPELATYLSE